VSVLDRITHPVRRARAGVRERRRRRAELAALRGAVSFQDKVRYKMLADRRPLLTTFADKVAVRDYVAERVGADLLPELHLVTDSPEAILRAELPRGFAFKPSHASGACVVVADFAPEDAELPATPDAFAGFVVRPENADRVRLSRLGAYWLSRGYRTYEEWAYLNVPRRLLVEELLEVDGAIPLDFKLSVFHGRVRVIQVELDRYTNHLRNFYTPEWERLDVAATKYPPGPDVARPGLLDEMVRVAERLGAETDYVRVDLYEIGTRIVFGELTNYPEAGRVEFVPPEFDIELGRWWSLPKRYR
jgi:hypothetical protein